MANRQNMAVVEDPEKAGFSCATPLAIEFLSEIEIESTIFAEEGAIISGHHKQTHTNLQNEDSDLGKEPPLSIQVPDSFKHCQIHFTFQDRCYFIEDCSSSDTYDNPCN